MMDWEKLNKAIDKAIEERDKLVIHELEKKKQQVEWLLREIEKRRKEVWEGDWEDVMYWDGYADALDFIEEKIKQAFPDVFENDEGGDSV